MADFRSFMNSERVPAVPLEPLVDPAGWTAEALADLSNWSYVITDRDSDELIAGVEAVRRRGVPLVDIATQDFPLADFACVLADVRRELSEGRGIVMLRNFPIDRLDREGQAIAYLGLGSYLGKPMSQNKQGHILGHVKDLGGDYSDAQTRGYLTRAEMRFHTDPCDYVGLLCLNASKSGGESRIASSVTVYNRMLEQRPNLVKVLTEDFYRTHSGETSPGESPWYKQPIFSFTQGYFSATAVSAGVEKAQGLPGVPPFTPAQKEAADLYKKTAEACALDIEFKPGDIQFLNNYVMLHTRRAFEDWPDPSRKRHLLRLWLSYPASRPIPKEQREGRSGRGVQVAGIKPNAPLDVEAA